jgi:hypothetical protein
MELLATPGAHSGFVAQVVPPALLRVAEQLIGEDHPPRLFFVARMGIGMDLLDPPSVGSAYLSSRGSLVYS